jgi:hypothetical protein
MIVPEQITILMQQAGKPAVVLASRNIVLLIEIRVPITVVIYPKLTSTHCG